MKRIIVTGASGFVGANLARRLIRDGHEVHLLLRRGFATWRVEGLRDDARLHEVEFGEADALTRTVHAIRPEWIFHLAVHGAYSSQTDAARMARTNVIGTINLVEACLATGFEAFVNTGSSSEYGFKDHAPAEDEALEPNSVYAVTKAAATSYCRHIGRGRGVHMPTLRLYSIYGPWEEPTRLIPAIIVRGLDGALPPLVDPAIARDYVYVDDAVEAYLLAAAVPGQTPGAIYNVGSAVQTSLREVVETARRALAIPVEPSWGSMASRQWDTSTWVADNRAIRRALDWRPRHDFEQGLRLTTGWLREQPARLDFYRGRLARAG